MPNKVRATNPPPEQPCGGHWLVNAEQQLLCQFKPDSATVPAQWVALRSAAIAWHHPDHQFHTPHINALAQCHLGHGAQNRLAALQSAGSLQVIQKDSNNKVNRDKKSATTKRVALFGFFFIAIRVSQQLSLRTR